MGLRAEYTCFAFRKTLVHRIFLVPLKGGR